MTKLRQDLQQFERLIQAMSQHFSEDELLRLTHLAYNGHIRNGGFTPEYQRRAQQARQNRSLAESLQPLNQAQTIITQNFQPDK